MTSICSNPVDHLKDDKDLCKLWESYTRNEFCRAMFASKKDADKCFRNYAVQDYFYLWEYVRHVARVAACAPTIEMVKDYAQNISSAYAWGERWKEICIRDLNIKPSEFQTPCVEPLTNYLKWLEKKYLEWLKNKENHQGQGSTWLDFHVMSIPCIVGYYEIACWFRDEATSPNENFYEHWVKPNANRVYVDSLRSYFEDSDQWEDDDETWSRWKGLFREALILEHELFKSFVPRHQTS
ncbi:heme oxygenase-like protein [Clavulina sp. PMI_390]|nr:heme oxygenase-like protein [Clavulina sp. PMI_390]